MGAILPRLALGASWNPDVFDGTAVLSLCYGDPDMQPPLVYVRFAHHVIPQMSERQVASLTSPRAFLRTGYGAKLRFDIEFAYETGTLGGTGLGPPVGTGSHAGADISIDALMSILGRSAGQVTGTGGANSPPYLFLSPNYQSSSEQWFAVEIDPSAGDPEITQPFVMKTWMRSVALSLVSRKTWNRINLSYQPHQFVRIGAGTANVPVYPGSGTTTITLTNALEQSVTSGDALLVLWPPYQWWQFLINSIDATRKIINVISFTPWPTALATASYRTRQNSNYFITPNYALTDFVGNPGPTTFFNPLPFYVKVIGAGANL